MSDGRREKKSKKFKFKNIGIDKWILLAAAGVLLVIVSLPVKSEDREEQVSVVGPTAEIQNDAAYRKSVEENLEALLSEINGAGKVSVMITWESTAEKVIQEDSLYEKNKNSQEGEDNRRVENEEIRNQQNSVYITDENGNQIPYVVKELTPSVSGIAVVAEGGKNPQVAAAIIEVVEALFELPANKVAVSEMQ